MPVGEGSIACTKIINNPIAQFQPLETLNDAEYLRFKQCYSLENEIF